MWGPNQLAVVLLGAYALAGVVVAVALGRRGMAPGVSVSALAVWPLLLPLLEQERRPSGGPLGARIDEVFQALGAVLAETGTADLGTDLEGLRAALHRADERLALADRLLARPLDEGPAAARLAEARTHASSEIEAVLAGLLELRLQVGLLTLSGGGGSVIEQLRALQQRVSALEEVAGVR